MLYLWQLEKNHTHFLHFGSKFLGNDDKKIKMSNFSFSLTCAVIRQCYTTNSVSVSTVRVVKCLKGLGDREYF